MLLKSSLSSVRIRSLPTVLDQTRDEEILSLVNHQVHCSDGWPTSSEEQATADQLALVTLRGSLYAGFRQQAKGQLKADHKPRPFPLNPKWPHNQAEDYVVETTS
eukprot:6476638-Amphidinium_carterae.1